MWGIGGSETETESTKPEQDPRRGATWRDIGGQVGTLEIGVTDRVE